MKLKVGQKLTRLLAGVVPMKVTIESIDNKENTFMVSSDASGIDGWIFDIKTGVEIDDFLKWGPKYGTTGSYIKEIVKSNDKVKIKKMKEKYEK